MICEGKTFQSWNLFISTLNNFKWRDDNHSVLWLAPFGNSLSCESNQEYQLLYRTNRENDEQDTLLAKKRVAQYIEYSSLQMSHILLLVDNFLIFDLIIVLIGEDQQVTVRVRVKRRKMRGDMRKRSKRNERRRRRRRSRTRKKGRGRRAVSVERKFYKKNAKRKRLLSYNIATPLGNVAPGCPFGLFGLAPLGGHCEKLH